jgi:GT2 family glycosyltransferase
VGKTVCAIVPTFNRASFVPECLDSLLLQTRPVDQIIVVNDGSTDKTEDVLRSYGDRIRVLRQENGGKSAALNTALAVCENDYVWICDDDDIAEPDACAALAGALDADDRVGFAYGWFRRFRDINGTREILPMSYWPKDHETAFFLELLERCFIFQFCSMIRRSVYRDVGPFDTHLLRSEDYEMIVRVARRYKGTYVDKPLFLQRIHAGIRGTAPDRFSAEASAAKWLSYDRVIFDRMRNEWPLEELMPPFARSLPEGERQRASVLERACISGRHAMWNECIADLERARDLSPTSPVSQAERAIVGRTLSEPETIRYLIEDRSLSLRLQSLLKNSTFGRSIADAFAAPLFWQIKTCAKERQLSALWSRFRFLISLLGMPRVLSHGSILTIRRLASVVVGL